LMTDHTGRDLVSYGELALDEKGKILAIRSQSLFQVGAYFVGPGMVSGLFSMRFIPEAYDVQAIHLMCKGVFTNTPQAGPYRGAGRAGVLALTLRHELGERDPAYDPPEPLPDRPSVPEFLRPYIRQ
jgi:CO/xanthine dehydrogenase Mo-binding subunit